MEKLKVLANNYVEENVNNVLKDAFAKVYADGYRNGYKDREEEISINLQDGETEYVDLGLSSGTLWASDYERHDEKAYLYVPYGKAESYNIPTQEQWEELCDACEWDFKIDGYYDLVEVRCVGPNGNVLVFNHTGKKNYNELQEEWEAYFWLQDNKEEKNKSAVHMYNLGKDNRYKKLFSI